MKKPPVIFALLAIIVSVFVAVSIFPLGYRAAPHRKSAAQYHMREIYSLLLATGYAEGYGESGHGGTTVVSWNGGTLFLADYALSILCSPSNGCPSRLIVIYVPSEGTSGHTLFSGGQTLRVKPAEPGNWPNDSWVVEATKYLGREFEDAFKKDTGMWTLSVL